MQASANHATLCAALSLKEKYARSQAERMGKVVAFFNFQKGRENVPECTSHRSQKAAAAKR